jgi:hypothetical protein
VALPPFIFTTPPNSATGGTALHGSSVVTTAGPNPGFSDLNDSFVPWVLGFNMDTDAPKIFARGAFAESAMDFMGTGSTDYRHFRRGNKLIVYSGQADPVFSSKYHIRWYNRLVDDNGGLHRTQDFARLFVVPGMNHCGGGPATSQFDAFAALVKWVERDKAPDSLLGTAGADTPWPGRTRPLCPYPEYALQGARQRRRCSQLRLRGAARRPRSSRARRARRRLIVIDARWAAARPSALPASPRATRQHPVPSKSIPPGRDRTPGARESSPRRRTAPRRSTPR